MSKDEKKPTVTHVSSDDEQPEIYGIKKGKNGIILNRRSFLSALATAGALASCPPAIAAGKNKPAASPKTLGRSQAHEAPVNGLVLRDNLLFSWDPGTLKAWDLAKGDLKKSVTRAGLREELEQAGDTFPAVFLHTWDDLVLAYGPDGKTLAVNSEDGVTLWKSANGKPEKIRTLENPPRLVIALAFHPDGKRVAAGGGDGFVVWDLDDGNMQRFEGGKSNLSSLAFHPNKPLLLSAHSDGKVRVWRLSDGKTEKTLKCHVEMISHLEVTPDGALAITASIDQTIKFWSLSNGKQKASLDVPLAEILSAMDLSPDGQILAIGTMQGRIYLWRLPEGEMMGCLFDQALLEKGTQMARYRQMGGQIQTQPCDEALLGGATCVCDCVGDNRMCRTTQQICTCDTIAVPAGYSGGKEVCVCNTISVGTKAGKTTTPSGCSCVGHVTRPSGCSCVGHVTGGGSHYWRPN